MEQQELTPTEGGGSTIAAIATPHGEGGIAVIRVSGPDALGIVGCMWRGKDLDACASHTAHLGSLLQDDGTLLDQAVATVFRGPNSFTGEDTVEISVHGSRWIQREALNRLVQLGARPAGPGEFSRRAFLNRRMDLAQAEAVADLIAAGSKAAHRLAMQQMSGAFSRKLEDLRAQLVHFASLLELELDFAEEDVEFADRTALIGSAQETLRIVRRLAHSYAAGRVFKEGVPVAIAGCPNAGKSTLLNMLLDDDKAIVSDIPGTTRDVIEDTREIRGTLFRFYDTAGLRDTSDTIERIGIERARHHIERAAITLWVIDPSQPLEPQLDQLRPHLTAPDTTNILLLNKSDLPAPGDNKGSDAPCGVGTCLRHVGLDNPASLRHIGNPIRISAKTGEGIASLEEALIRAARTDHNPDSELIVTNARHFEALTAGAEALARAIDGLQSGIPSDLIAQDVREALHHLGLVTGAITTPDLLTSIFQNFCIGK